MYKKVLGLDIGSNSIGYSLLELNESKNEIIFNELISNSIVFSEPNTAEERRTARGSRRLHRRKSSRNKNSRTLFVEYKLADKAFISDATKYLQSMGLKDYDVYRLREKAVTGTFLSKDEFTLAVYSILTDRGYSNMFALVEEETEEQKKEDEKLNGAIQKNKDKYLENAYELPSMVLTFNRKELNNSYQNTPIRNKKGDYRNSLDRDMHIEEFKKVVLSQATNKDIFKSVESCEKFIATIVEEKYNAFYQRPLKSFEGMVEYCSFYDEFNPLGSEKRMPLSNVANVELTLRQSLDNYEVVNKNGETRIFTKDEKDTVVSFWLNTPSADKITNKNIYKNAGFKDVKIHVKDNKDLLILNIQAYRGMLDVLTFYKVDFQNADNNFYNEILLELYYYKNYSSRVEHITKIVKKYNLELDDSFSKEVAKLKYMDGFASLSLKFANEVLNSMNKDLKIHSEALNSLGFNDKYIGMPSYDYLPPLEPTKADIKWLQKNISYFETNHLFYQPRMSPKVKRVIAVLRKLINELIKKYGNIDEIRIETAKELNSTKEEDKIKKNLVDFNRKKSEAEKFLNKNKLSVGRKNIERAKLFIEQKCKCLYCDENLTKDEAFDETYTEIEHFIPRSVIWINSQKNKILVHKKCNQNKGSQNPINYLKSIGEWENFKKRIKLSPKSPKYKWLTDEDLINGVMQGEHWKESYLNDTRAATRAIQKYLNHYLYPPKTRHNKGGDRHISSVTGLAIHELKYIWGIHAIMPKNEEDGKDRNTNYHHTLDAFTIALCSPSAIQTLNNHFKKNENRFKVKAMKKSLESKLPQTKEGVNVVEHLKKLVEKYETNQFYVCPYNKRKTNLKGFKDGNLKLYVAKDPKNETKEILAEMEKVKIDTSILLKKDGLNFKDRKDDEVKKFIKDIQDRLNPQKQQNIIDAIEIYANALLKFRREIIEIDNEIKKLNGLLKKTVKGKEKNKEIKEEMTSYKEKKKEMVKKQQLLSCSYVVKNGKRQRVRTLRLHKVKIQETSADSIVFSNRDSKSIERLSLKNFNKALQLNEPFVIKENKNTLCVELYAHPKQNQVVGLKYFSSISNPHITTKINEKYKNIFHNVEPDLTLYKNDIIKVINTKEGTANYYIFNGGGNVTGTNNKLSIKHINWNKVMKENKKGKKIESKDITPNKISIVSKVKIDFFGNILEDKPHEK